MLCISVCLPRPVSPSVLSYGGFILASIPSVSHESYEKKLISDENSSFFIFFFLAGVPAGGAGDSGSGSPGVYNVINCWPCEQPLCSGVLSCHLPPSLPPSFTPSFSFPSILYLPSLSPYPSLTPSLSFSPSLTTFSSLLPSCIPFPSFLPYPSPIPSWPIPLYIYHSAKFD